MSISAEPVPEASPTSTASVAIVLDKGADAKPPLPVDESAAALELALQREVDDRREERFYWILVSVVLADMAMFPHMSWVSVVCTFLLEVITLIGLAQKLGNEKISILLDYLFHQICEKIGLGGKN
ncbi:MAG TPA: hypothetical protein VNR39_12480 [Pseudolabrys sp.]|nr:hypothetical protein [Pseudolabrys sp.]